MLDSCEQCGYHKLYLRTICVPQKIVKNRIITGFDVLYRQMFPEKKCEQSVCHKRTMWLPQAECSEQSVCHKIPKNLQKP